MDWPSGGPLDGSEVVLVQGIADTIGWVLVILAVLFAIPLLMVVDRVRRRRRFWCSQAGREVEVEFEETGVLPGFRHPVAVRSCTEFDPLTAVACNRRCLDSNVRVRLPMMPTSRWR
jgi:hypothetical protein